ncbi:MAG: hypothetical protein HQK65_18580 [Desulfamplus sp.]|nr:hypothetical protein [Desulfamplus sp.]
MEWLIGCVIFVLLCLWLLADVRSRDAKRNSKKSTKIEEDILIKAKEIADSITTIEQFHALEKKLEKSEEKLAGNTYKSEGAYEKASQNIDILQKAIDLTQSKAFQWQFTPFLNLNTPYKKLEHAYKVFSNDEYQKIKDTISDDKSEWSKLDGYGEKEDTDPLVKTLKKFREIVESQDSTEEQIKKINQLVSKNKTFAEEFFNSDNELKPGDQWFADKLREAGLPLAYELYAEGYTTLKKCLEINPEEFLKRKGVGPKKMEQLKQLQIKIQNENFN